MSTFPKPHSRRRDMLLVFAVALVLRLVYLSQMEHSPLYQVPLMDMRYHDEWAKRIAQGDWLGDKPFFRAPLYPYFLACIYRVFGHSLLAARVVQIVIGSVSCALLYLLALLLFSRGVALGCGLAAAAYGMLIYYDAELLLPALEVLFATGGLLLLYRWSARPSGGVAAGCGLAWGLAAVTRPNFLAFIPFGMAWVASRQWKTTGCKSVPIPLSAALLGCALPIGLVAVRNQVVGHDRVLICWQGGTNFYIGNNPHSDGMTAVLPGTRSTWLGGYNDAIRIAERHEHRHLKPSEVSRYWSAQALRFMRRQPGAWLDLMVRKAYFLWHGLEVANNLVVYGAGWHSLLFRVLVGRLGPVWFPFGVLAPLALLGMAVCWDRRGELFPLYAYVGIYGLTIVLFFVCARYRMPIIPVLLVFAGAAVARLRTWQRNREWRPLAAAASVLVLLCILLNFPLFGHNWVDWPKAHHDLATALQAQGKVKQAIAEYRKAIALAPDRADGYVAVAQTLLNAARPDEAEPALRKAQALQPNSPELDRLWAYYYLQKHQPERTRALVEKALNLDSQDAESFVPLARAELQGKQYERCLELCRQALQLQPDSTVAAELHVLRGLCYQEQKDYAGAKRCFEEALKCDPRRQDALTQLAAISVYFGEWNGARRLYETAVKQRPDSALLHARLGVCLLQQGDLKAARESLAKAVRLDPSLVEARVNLAVVSVHLGQFQEAERHALKAIIQEPRDTQIRLVAAAALGAQGKFKEGIAQCRAALAVDPNSEPARKLLAKCEAGLRKRLSGSHTVKPP